jgi:hypothetical protein
MLSQLNACQTQFVMPKGIDSHQNFLPVIPLVTFVVFVVRKRGCCSQRLS